MTQEAWIVVDLGFGDAGKGTVTDFIVRERSIGTVIRFNGGAQAGHNVVTPQGQHHTFSQLGSGTFVPGVRTHLAKEVVVDPLALLVEAERIAQHGITDALARLTIDPAALVITPYQRAINQMRERARGDGAHGTCGIGFGETVSDAIERPDLALRVRDLFKPAALPRKLAAMRAYQREKAQTIATHREQEPWLAQVERTEAWIEALAPFLTQVALRADEDVDISSGVVFEGAQGVLLDEWRGFHPHTTWSTCTTENADAFLARRGLPRARCIGVTRTYATRHGAGPLPTEASLGHPEPHNGDGGWQGSFRQGHLDLVLLRYALAVCPVDALAITHLDREVTTYCPRYRELDRIEPGPKHDLVYQRDLTTRLGQITPVLEPLKQPIGEMLEQALEVTVALESRGPTAAHKRWRGPFREWRSRRPSAPCRRSVPAL